jgi:prepilin-type N-terminal cleavage/methylation domain-containing protein
MTRRRKAGFTLVELLVVVTVIGLLSTIAIPKYQDFKRRATATQILGDFAVVQHAAMTFYSDSGYFPQEASAGSIPPNLTSYLPTNFVFQKPQWTMDYQHWKLPYMQLVGVAFSTSDKALGRTAVRLFGQSRTMTFGDVHLVVISGL